MFKVFVYGSLKKSKGNNDLLKDSEYLGEFITCDSNFHMFSFGCFPGVVKNNSEFVNSILGECYEVDCTTLQKLDYLEGNGSFYTRELVEIYSTNNGEGFKAWMYLLPHEDYRNDLHDDEGVSHIFDNTQEWI